jgi:2-C-methyl-D-erythritol 4-phosphate cytidylyltransferase
MNKVLFTLGLASAFCVSSLSADPLKNSLNNLLNEKDSSGMVNLGGVGVGAKPKPQVQQPVRKSRPGSAIIGRYNDGKPVRKKEANAYLKKATKGKIKDLDLLPRKQRLMVLKDLQKMYALKNFKSRPAKAIIATVNGKEIRKKEADTYLKNVTGGKVKDFDRLDKKQRLVLVKDLARPMVIMAAIDANITEEEREVIYKQMWIEKQKATIEVSSDEMLALYEMKKEKTLATNPQAEIPHYMSLGESLKAEIIEKKMMSNLLKDVNITINYDTNMTQNENNTTSVATDNTQNTKETE